MKKGFFYSLNVKSAAYKMVSNPSGKPLSISNVQKSRFSSAYFLDLVAPKVGNRYRRTLPEMD